MTNERYNGWTNYETWDAKLWIDNDEGFSNCWTEIAEECCADNEDYTDAVSALEDRLRSEHQANLPDLGASMADDLLRQAFDRIDWREIAQNYVDNIRVDRKVA